MKKLIFFLVIILAGISPVLGAVDYQQPNGSVTIPLGESGWAMIFNSPPGGNGISAPVIFGCDDDKLEIELDKTFRVPVGRGEPFSPLVVEFIKLHDNAPSTIVIADEYIVNDTLLEWTDFHMQLIVDLINPQAGFMPEVVPSGGQLECVNFSEPWGLNGMPTKLNFYNCQGGGVVADPPGEDVFRPGYEWGKIIIETNPQLPAGTRFGLKEYPSVPEPITAVLLSIGAVVIRAGRRE